MLRLYYNDRLTDLIQHLGPQNVFVSIVESGSQEDTKGALSELEGKLNALGVEHRISLGINVTEQTESLKKVPKEGEDRTGWIFTGRGEQGWEIRRIPYLAGLRNQAMEPLDEMKDKWKFDRVLWINDVVFSVGRSEIRSVTCYQNCPPLLILSISVDRRRNNPPLHQRWSIRSSLRLRLL